MHADIHDKDFGDICPSDGSKLLEIDEKVRPIQCPRYIQALFAKTSSPLEETAAQHRLVN